MTCLFYFCVVVLLGATYQIHGMPLADPDNYVDALLHERHQEVVVSSVLDHQLICQKAVTYASKDLEYSKRDDVFLNLVINVCLPDVDGNKLLQLLTDFQSKSTTTKSPQWDEGLLPEVGPGQEGFGDNDEEDETDPTEETPELIGGLPAETGPGQEGVNSGGNASEETDTPDWTENNDNWWDGMFPETVITTKVPGTNDDDEEPPSWRKRDKKSWQLISALLANIINDDSGSSSSSSEEESDNPPTKPASGKNPTTEAPAPKQTTVFTTEAPVPSTARQTTQSPTTTAGITTTLQTTQSPTTTVGTTISTTTLPPVQPNRKNTDQDETDERELNELLRRLLIELENGS
ncbi:uncharacterized protein [Amphiura filiformis]|uniref:uncharacterized protein n=1 Tax=Amphiura filiformis TaxID=82378 RepID=UPI003B21FDDD